MGTNYYWRLNSCEHCGRFDEVHVGKQSAGWSFIFRGWPHRLMNAAHPDWGHEPCSPLGFPVLSRADWRVVFTQPGGLFDEYGHEVPDPVGWLDGLEPPSAEQIERETGWSADFPAWMTQRSSRDAEGFRVDTGEFS